MSEQLPKEESVPKLGERCRVWHGQGFTRSGRIIRVDSRDREVLVEYDYDIPNEWVKWSKLC